MSDIGTGPEGDPRSERVVTLIGVIVIVLLGRPAARIKAEPVEFKYPGAPKT